MATSTKTSWFAPKLRSALERKDMSVRALARTWRPDGDPETSRRSLNRYLNKGIVPSALTRGELAEALGVEVLELEPGAEDEEEDRPVDFGSAISALIDRAVEAKIEARLRKLVVEEIERSKEDVFS